MSYIYIKYILNKKLLDWVYFVTKLNYSCKIPVIPQEYFKYYYAQEKYSCKDKIDFNLLKFYCMK